MRVTKHGQLRLKERAGFNRVAALRMAARALTEGISHGETTGRLRNYLDGLYRSNYVANNMRIHGEFIYLFTGETLITVLNLPNEHKKAANKLRKKEEL